MAEGDITVANSRQVNKLPAAGSRAVALKNGQEQRYILKFYNDNRPFISYLKKREEGILKLADELLSTGLCADKPEYDKIAQELLISVVYDFDSEGTADIGDVRLIIKASNDRGFLPPEDSDPSIPIIQPDAGESERLNWRQ